MEIDKQYSEVIKMMCANCNKEIKDDKYERCLKCGFSICSKCMNGEHMVLCAGCIDELMTGK